MKRLIIPVFVLLGACTEIQQGTDKAGRNAAKSMMPEALALYFPQVPKELFVPFTDCVVDNASVKEVQSLASDAVVGVDQQTADTIRAILARPETQECLQSKVSGSLGQVLAAQTEAPAYQVVLRGTFASVTRGLS